MRAGNFGGGIIVSAEKGILRFLTDICDADRLSQAVRCAIAIHPRVAGASNAGRFRLAERGVCDRPFGSRLRGLIAAER